MGNDCLGTICGRLLGLSLWTERNYNNSQSLNYKIPVFPPWIQYFHSLYSSLHILLEHMTNKGVRLAFTKSTCCCHCRYSCWSAKLCSYAKYHSCFKNVKICKLLLMAMRSLDLFNWTFHFLNCGCFNKNIRLSQELTAMSQHFSETHFHLNIVKHFDPKTFHCCDFVKGSTCFLDI